MFWRTPRNATRNGKQHLIACRERQWKPDCMTAISFPKAAGTSESRFSGCAGRLRPDSNAASRHLVTAGSPRLFLPKWTDQIMAEVSRNLQENFGVTAEQAAYRES